jgi:myo-inositol 2-dehydrogenase / D-chiro-inositol 1-dehydrogenase
MGELRVAVVGCGRMGSLRAEAANELGAQVVAVLDPREGVAGHLAHRYSGCQPLLAASELDLSGLDAIFVCSPPAARGDLEVRAALRGISVFMEKPIGISAAHASPLREAVRRGRGLSAVGYMNRYRQSVRSARADLLDEVPLGATGFWVNAPYGVPWWSDPGQSGGPINEQATHLVDLCRFLLGDVTEVRAVARYPESRPSASVILNFESGTVASLFYSCGAVDKRIGLEVFTHATSVLLDGWNLDRVDPVTRETKFPAVQDRYQIFTDETAAFLRAVESGERGDILCDFEEAVRTQIVVDAILRSADTGSAVRIPA